MPNGVNLVTGIPFEAENYVSEYSVAQEELKVSCNNFLVFTMCTQWNLNFSQTLLAQPLGPVKGKGKGKKAAAGAATKVETAPAVETKA